MLSVVLIIPADLRDKANALGEALGHGPNNYSVALTNATAPTHYGLHTWATQAFVDMLAAGVMPEGLDYPQDDFDLVMNALTKSVRESMEGHFTDVCVVKGLAIVEVA